MQAWLVFPTIAFLVVPILDAQSKPSGVGHWQGTVQMPDRELKVALDLAQNDKNEWIGDLDLPDLRIVDAPLGNIVVNGKSVSFSLADAPGAPTFQGLLSDDGKELKGQFSASNGNLSTSMKWVSEPNVRLPVKSTPIGGEFEGDWVGTLSAPDGRQLRLRVTLTNEPESATGTLAILDQGWPDLPLNGIVQQGSKISFELKAGGGRYNGQLKDGCLVGEWSQEGRVLPMTLKRTAEEKK
jgi:hypothetical protein